MYCFQFRIIVSADVVKHNSWPQLVPDLRSAIQNSNLINNGAHSQWNTINALTILHALLRPFQVVPFEFMLHILLVIIALCFYCFIIKCSLTSFVLQFHGSIS